MAEIFNFSTFGEKKIIQKQFIKDKMTGRVNILLGCIFEKIVKVKIETTGPKKKTFLNVFKVINQKICFSVTVTSF